MRINVSLAIAAAMFVALANASAQDDYQSDLSTPLSLLMRNPLPQTNANEVIWNGAGYSGIVVDLFTAPQPLQLINPFAPLDYSSPEDNTLRDLYTGRAEGLKLFSVRF